MTTIGSKSTDVEVMAQSASAAISYALEKEKKDYNRRRARSSKLSRRPGTPITKSVPEEKVLIEKSTQINRVALKKGTEESSYSTVRRRNGGSNVESAPQNAKTVSRIPVVTPPIKGATRTESSNSPNGLLLTPETTISDAFPPSDVPFTAASTKARFSRRSTFGGFLNKLFKGKFASSKLHLPTCGAVGSSTDDILRGLDFLTPLSTPEHQANGRSNDTAMDEVIANPKKVLRKVSRYRKKAKKLLSIVPRTNLCNNVTVNGINDKDCTDSRDMEANARKAFQYAAEARRLNDLLKAHYSGRLSPSPSVSTALSNPDASWQEVRELILHDMPITETYNPPVVVESCSVTSDERTVFSERIEREDHQRRMNELKLFTATDLNFVKSDNKIKAGEFYVSEAHRILRTFSNEVNEVVPEDMSTMSPVSVFSGKTMTTTCSELDARAAYQAKLAELELFSASNFTGSVTHMLASMQSTLDSSFLTFTNIIMTLPTKKDDDNSIFDTGVSGDESSRAHTRKRPVMPYEKRKTFVSGSTSDGSCSESTSTSKRSSGSLKSLFSEHEAISEGSETEYNSEGSACDTATRDSHDESSRVESQDDSSESGSEATSNSHNTGRSDHTGQSSRTWHSEYTGLSSQAGNSEYTHQSSRTGHSEYTDQSSKTGHSEYTSHSEYTGQSSQSGHSEHTGQNSQSGYSEYTSQSSQQTKQNRERGQSGLTEWSAFTETSQPLNKPVDDPVQQAMGWIRRL